MGNSRKWLASSSSSSKLREYRSISSGTLVSEQCRLSTNSTCRLQPLNIGMHLNIFTTILHEGHDKRKHRHSSVARRGLLLYPTAYRTFAAPTLNKLLTNIRTGFFVSFLDTIINLLDIGFTYFGFVLVIKMICTRGRFSQKTPTDRRTNAPRHTFWGLSRTLTPQKPNAQVCYNNIRSEDVIFIATSLLFGN